MGPAKDAALKALAIDESVALAHAALGNVYELFESPPFQAQAEHLRAMELDDHDVWVLRGYSSFLYHRDAFDEALALKHRDLELDPTSPYSNRLKAVILYTARRYGECVAESHRTLTLDPEDLGLSYPWLARCLEQQGKLSEAVDALEKRRVIGRSPELAEGMKRLYAEYQLEGVLAGTAEAG